MSEIVIKDIQTKLPKDNIQTDLERILIDIRINFKTIVARLPGWDDKIALWDEAYTHSQTTGNPHNTTADNIIFTQDESIYDILSETLNSGVLHDITINDDGGLNISWSACEIYNHLTAQVINTVAGSGTCTNNSPNYLIWASGTGLTLQTSIADIAAGEINVAHISCQNNDIWAIHKNHTLSGREQEVAAALGQMFPAIVTDGLLIEEDTDVTNAFDVKLNTGVYYHDGHERHTLSSAVYSRTTAMVRWFHSGGVWTNNTNAQIDATKWDNGTALVANTAAKYYRSLFIVVEDTIHWIYPQKEFNTIAQAIVGTPVTVPPGLADHPRSVAVVLKGDAAAFPAAGSEQWIDLRPMINRTSSGSAVSDHGALSGLTDDDHTQYILVDGTRAFTGNVSAPNVLIPDSGKLILGTGSDFEIYHNGITSTIFRNLKQDGDTRFYVNDGGSDTLVMYLDGSDSRLVFSDNMKTVFGTGFDFEIYHDGTNTLFRNLLSDSDTKFYVNDGGSDTLEINLDGATGNIGVGAEAPSALGANVRTIDIRSSATGSSAGAGISMGQTTTQKAAVYSYGDDLYLWSLSGTVQVGYANVYIQGDCSAQSFTDRP
jgi:hypothetical protein